MGMDLNVYQLLRPLDPNLEDYPANSRGLSVTTVQFEALRKLFADLQARDEEFVSLERLREFAGVPGNWDLSAWDLGLPRGWAEFSDPACQQASVLVEVDSQQFLDKGPLVTVVFEVCERGYLRKPFRFHDTPSRVEGDTLVLTVDNFTGCDMAKVTEALGAQVMEDSSGVFGYSDLPRLQVLKDLCSMPNAWQRQVLDQMAPDCVAVIDW